VVVALIQKKSVDVRADGRASGLPMISQPDIADLRGEPISRGNLRAQVTARLMTGIFAGSLRSGQRLVVQQLAKAYVVSPTPVREALVEMASLGLVDLLPNRGAIVRPFGPTEVREITQVRRLLETEATRSACGRIPPDELSALDLELKRLEFLQRDQTWDRDARAADTRLHGLIAECCGNLRLAVEIGRYLVLFRALRDVCHLRDAGRNYSRADDVPEHLAIIRPLLNSDADAAARAMDSHIRSAAVTIEEVVFRDRENLEVTRNAEALTEVVNNKQQ
jgi:DNA-binding GntR family transcriptional regulator